MRIVLAAAIEPPTLVQKTLKQSDESLCSLKVFLNVSEPVKALKSNFGMA